VSSTTVVRCFRRNLFLSATGDADSELDWNG
jgi:hypothetical protein